MWALLALGAALLTSFNPILYKKMLKDVSSVTVVFAVVLLSLPPLAVFSVFLTPQFPALDWLFMVGVVGSAVLNVGAHLASTRALQLEDTSLVTPLLIFSPVFTVIISAIFLDEIPSLIGVTGVGLVLIGAYWLNHNPGSSWLAPLRALAFKPGIMLVLLAGLLWSVTPVLEKVALEHTNPVSPRFTVLVINILLVALLTPVVLTRGRTDVGNLKVHPRELLLAGLIAGIAPVLGYTALSLGLVGYVTTLFKLSTLMTVLWGGLLLGESGLRRRLPASLVMVVGAVLITL
ncbi:MAG: hypothetical protein FOGNACKC_03351 [Anaerolineae bacterium]|nr:hypothetical protein [Anaerolineae bacterium]